VFVDATLTDMADRSACRPVFATATPRMVVVVLVDRSNIYVGYGGSVRSKGNHG
jgi:hypothetical protein